MKRRKFLSWVGFGGLITQLPLFVASCAQKTNQSSVDGFEKVGTLTDLKQKGQLSNGEILVLSDLVDSKKIIAVNPSCTHAGCAVTWEKDEKAFVCPCHDSKFAIDGRVLQGPANTPLPTYVTKVEGDFILVKKT